MISDLVPFINELRNSHHEVILLIDTNEAFIFSDYCLAKITRQTNTTYQIFNKHGNCLEPNTCKRGSERINCCFCTPYIEELTIRSSITPFDLLTSLDYRGIYLDINILTFIKYSFTNLPTPDSRFLTSTNLRAVEKYKND